MSNSTKQSPLGVNVLSGFLQNTGITINPIVTSYMGSSTSVSNYTPGSLVNTTVLSALTSAIREAWVLFDSTTIAQSTYDAIISIGSTTLPALGNSPPSTYTWSGSPFTTSTQYQITSYGYARLFPKQAYDEFNYNGTVALTGNYKDFFGSFLTTTGFISMSNGSIMTMQNALSFLDGTYSNMDDLISADITGVSLSTTVFGQDLINSGKAINLTTISTFGLPSNLLETLKKYNALTQSLSLALLASGLTPNEINTLTSNTNVTDLQQQQAYAALLIITGIDLANILIPLNCNTKGLNSLADLLDVKKLFPNSYQSLTVPVYNATPGPTNSKTYYPIYINQGVNSGLNNPAITKQVGSINSSSTGGRGLSSGLTPGSSTVVQPLPEGFGSYLQNILPNDIAVSAGAFSVTMQQIRNISNVPVEKFAQVVASIETTRGLTVNGTNIPTDVVSAQAGLDLVAFGTGPYKTYTFSDFFGCMSGLPYPWESIQTLISKVQTTTLQTIYTNLYNATLAANEANMLIYIAQANAEIASIYATRNTNSNINSLNRAWTNTGSQLTSEQNARTTGLPTLPSPRDANIYPFPIIIYSMVESITSYSKDTAPNMAAQTLEAIANLSNTTGQSLIGLMRAERNQERLIKAGITLDNNIPDIVPLTEQKELIANGTVANSSPATLQQYDSSTETYYSPIPIGTYDANTNEYLVNTSPANTTNTIATTTGVPIGTTIATTIGVPIATGAPIFPGSLAGSPYANIIEPQLSIVYTSDILLPASYPVQQAIEQVILCNCDCWVQ